MNKCCWQLPHVHLYRGQGSHRVPHPLPPTSEPPVLMSHFGGGLDRTGHGDGHAPSLLLGPCGRLEVNGMGIKPAPGWPGDGGSPGSFAPILPPRSNEARGKRRILPVAFVLFSSQGPGSCYAVPVSPQPHHPTGMVGPQGSEERVLSASPPPTVARKTTAKGHTAAYGAARELEQHC